MKRLAVSVVVFGWLLFVLSFFLTAIVTVDDTIMGWRVIWHLEFPGWLAAAIGFASLDDLRANPFSSIVLFAAALTNLVMLVSPWAVFRLHSWLARSLPLAMLVAIFVNVAVLVLRRQDTVLGPGYYLWVASFLVVTVGLCMARFRGIAQSHDVSQSRVA